MNKKKYLAELLDAGLITPTQHQSILVHDRHGDTAREHRWFSYILFGLGGIAVALGLLSLIASNWAAIPASVKLCGNWLLIALASGGLYELTRCKSDSRAREALLLIWAALVLGGMALIGQIYQLESDPRRTFTLWWLLITPATILIVQGRFVALLWLALTVALTIANAVYYLIPDSYNDIIFAGFISSLWCLAPLGLLMLFHRTRPTAIGHMALWLSIAALASTAVFSSYLFSTSLLFGIGAVAPPPSSSIPYYVCSLLLVFLAAYYVFLPKAKTEGYVRELKLFIGAGMALLFVCLFYRDLPRIAAEFIDFILVTGYWVAITWIALRLKRIGIARFASFLALLKLVISYFTLMGDLATTGLGLLLSGLLFLTGAYGFSRLQRRLPQLAQEV